MTGIGAHAGLITCGLLALALGARVAQAQPGPQPPPPPGETAPGEQPAAAPSSETPAAAAPSASPASVPDSESNVPPLAAEQAAPPARFGHRDAFVLSVERIFGFQEQYFGDGTISSVGLHPVYWSGLGFHMVTKSGLTLGTLFGYTYLHEPATSSSGKDSDASLIWLRPRIGYATSLEKLGIWVRVGPTVLLSLDHTNGKSHDAISAGGELYGVVFLAPHVGLLVGPHFEAKLAADEGSNKYGSAGLTFGLMGEFY